MLRVRLQQLNARKLKQHRLLMIKKTSLADVPRGCKDSTDGDLFEVKAGLSMRVVSFLAIGCDYRFPTVGSRAAIQARRRAPKMCD